MISFERVERAGMVSRENGSVLPNHARASIIEVGCTEENSSDHRAEGVGNRAGHETRVDRKCLEL